MKTTEQPWNSDKAFYYPYIEIQNINWLKLSLLYWDGLRRMVPSGVLPDDSPDVQQIVQAGLLENTSPDIYLKTASDKFLSYLQPLMRYRGTFPLLKGFLSHDLKTAQTWCDDSSYQQFDDQTWDIQDFRKNLYKIYPVEQLFRSQLTVEAGVELEERSLAKRTGEKLEVDPFIGGLYRMCLASEMSEKIGVPLVTDSPYYKTYGEYFSFGSPAEHKISNIIPYQYFSQPSDTSPFYEEAEKEEFPSVLVKLDIKFPSLKSLEPIPISRIIKFHEKYDAERKRFRQEIESVIITANTIDDPNALSDLFSKKRQEIKSAFADHKKSLEELGIKSVGSLLAVSAPSAMTAIAGLTVPPVAAIITGLGITFSLVNWWAGVRATRRENVSSFPWHYLLTAKKFV